jgi:hypothetical protein
MNLSGFRALNSPAGQAALLAAEALEPKESDFLRHFTTLSRRLPADLARAALETAVLRRKAAAKFPFAAQMFFTAEALEQASSYEISSYRAGRFVPFQRLIDLGCSIGGDTLALAGAAPTLGIDIDPLRLALAQANLNALGLDGRTAFIQADLTSPLPLARLPGLAIFFDPARRAGGRRIFSVRDYHPPLAMLHEWQELCSAAGVKISPGVSLAELAGYDAEVEFISLSGELKEAVLWFGPLKTARRRATLLPGGHTMVDPGKEASLPMSEPRAYLYEPDPAVLRAGLVAPLGVQLDAAQLDPDIAYLTAEKRQPTPFARVWAVEGWFPFGLKRLRAYLRQREVGLVTVKKRGSPLQPEELIRDLRLSGNQERVVFLTHLRGRPVVVVCFPEEKGE